MSHSSDHPSALNIHQPDARYAELVTGEYVDLSFAVPTAPRDQDRSYVLETKGYYLPGFGEERYNRPLEFGLNGNYPNPFNPSTTIRYSLAHETEVNLKIFNILGQSVRTLVMKHRQQAGSYEAWWDGTDNEGRNVPTGAYLVKLWAGDFIETRKMVLVK